MKLVAHLYQMANTVEKTCLNVTTTYVFHTRISVMAWMIVVINQMNRQSYVQIWHPVLEEVGTNVRMVNVLLWMLCVMVMMIVAMPQMKITILSAIHHPAAHIVVLMNLLAIMENAFLKLQSVTSRIHVEIILMKMDATMEPIARAMVQWEAASNSAKILPNKHSSAGATEDTLLTQKTGSTAKTLMNVKLESTNVPTCAQI